MSLRHNNPSFRKSSRGSSKLQLPKEITACCRAAVVSALRRGGATNKYEPYDPEDHHSHRFLRLENQLQGELDIARRIKCIGCRNPAEVSRIGWNARAVKRTDDIAGHAE